MAEYTKELLHPVVSESIIIDGAAVAAGAIVYQEQVPLLPPDRGGIAPFVRSSSIHGRSMEDSRGYFLKPSPIVDTSSPERDVYSALSIKGADSRKPEAGYSRMEPNKVRVYGMLDASVAERIFAVSAHLREEGVLTEWPIYFARPKTFPSVEGSTNLTGFRNRIGEDYSSRIPALREKAKQEGGRIIPVGEAGFVMQAISELKLGVLYRAMITNVRVSELGEVPQEIHPGTPQSRNRGPTGP